MISHKYKCIFIHQRKSAGTSIKLLFKDVVPNSPEWHDYTDGVLHPYWSDDNAYVREYFKFTVIRNPWDRFVSGWKYCSSTRDRSMIDVLNSLPKSGHDYRHITRQQTETIVDQSESFVVDRLFRFESLEDVAVELRAILGLRATKIPKVNVAEPRANYREHFGVKERELFSNHFSDDVRLLGYNFD